MIRFTLTRRISRNDRFIWRRWLRLRRINYYLIIINIYIYISNRIFCLSNSVIRLLFTKATWHGRSTSRVSESANFVVGMGAYRWSEKWGQVSLRDWPGRGVKRGLANWRFALAHRSSLFLAHGLNDTPISHYILLNVSLSSCFPRVLCILASSSSELLSIPSQRLYL